MSRWLAGDFFLRSSKQTPSVRRRGPRVFVSFQFLRYLGTFLGEAASVFVSLSSNNTFFFLRLGSRARVRELSQFSGNSTREGMFADDAARGRPVRPSVRPSVRASVGLLERAALRSKFRRLPFLGFRCPGRRHARKKCGRHAAPHGGGNAAIEDAS